MQPLKICLLGGFELYRGNRPLKLRTTKIKSLFAYLVTHRHCPQPRELLAEMFWGELGAARARSNLRYALCLLRRELGPWLVIERHQVRFNTHREYWLDVEEFEKLISDARELEEEESSQALRKALQLYRGDFLLGFYDDWVLEEQVRLRDLYREALDSLTPLHKLPRKVGEPVM